TLNDTAHLMVPASSHSGRNHATVPDPYAEPRVSGHGPQHVTSYRGAELPHQSEPKRDPPFPSSRRYDVPVLWANAENGHGPKTMAASHPGSAKQVVLVGAPPSTQLFLVAASETTSGF